MTLPHPGELLERGTDTDEETIPAARGPPAGGPADCRRHPDGVRGRVRCRPGLADRLRPAVAVRRQLPRSRRRGPPHRGVARRERCRRLRGLARWAQDGRERRLRPGRQLDRDGEPAQGLVLPEQGRAQRTARGQPADDARDRARAARRLCPRRVRRPLPHDRRRAAGRRRRAGGPAARLGVQPGLGLARLGHRHGRGDPGLRRLLPARGRGSQVRRSGADDRVDQRPLHADGGVAHAGLPRGRRGRHRGHPLLRQPAVPAAVDPGGVGSAVDHDLRRRADGDRHLGGVGLRPRQEAGGLRVGGLGRRGLHGERRHQGRRPGLRPEHVRLL